MSKKDCDICGGTGEDKDLPFLDCEACSSPAELAAYDEAKERELFEISYGISDGIYWSKDCEAYRSLNGRPVEASDALDATMRLQGWKACAKSRARSAE